ncbi:MAG: ketopantoate reductase family protein [Desulfopila sp.]
MKIGVVGAGAMGGFFGGHLQRAGHQVTLVDTWQHHIDTINTWGLTIRKDDGEMVVRVAACQPQDLGGELDLILLMVKSFHTQAALHDIRHAITAGTVIMTLQNGIGHVDKIAAFAPPNRIIQGITTYPADLEGPGQVSSTGQGMIKMMTVDGQYSPILEEVCQAFCNGGLDCQIEPEVTVAIWEKLAFNAAMNGLCAILNIKVGGLGDSTMGRELAKTIVAEVVEVALKKQIPVQHERILATMDMAFAEHREHQPSMLKDILSGKPPEVEAIHGAPVQEGRRLGLALPVCETVYRLIRIIEDQDGR